MKRTHIYTRAHALVRIRERRATADFAFCSRCFLCVLLPLFFSTLPQTPYLSFSDPLVLVLRTLDAPSEKRAFFPLFFFARHHYAAQRDF